MDRRKNPRDPSTSRSRVWVWKRRGGAALRKTESGKPKDRLRCTLGLFKTVWMIGCPEKQQSRSFDSSSDASFLGLVQDGTFMRIEIGDSGYSNPTTAIIQPTTLFTSKKAVDVPE